MAHPQKPPYRRKNLPKICYPSQVIANFVSNFVAMATGVSRGKMQLAAFDGPSPTTPLWMQKSRRHLLHKATTVQPVISTITITATTYSTLSDAAAFIGLHLSKL